jgi:hypothetical protein
LQTCRRQDDQCCVTDAGLEVFGDRQRSTHVLVAVDEQCRHADKGNASDRSSADARAIARRSSVLGECPGLREITFDPATVTSVIT